MSSKTMASKNSSCSDSLNGLTFGQKIYFEDVGVGVPAKSGGGSSAAGGLPPPAPAKKGRASGGGGGALGPKCQVEGCKVDLSDAKAYYSRHKVCGMHSKSGKVIVSGLEQRFCQQCSRFHLLPEFDQGKRSCRRRLAGHNERRRKPAPGSLLSTRYGNMTTSLFENNSGSGGFLMDFTTYPRFTGRDEWPPTRTSEQVSSNQSSGFGKFQPSPSPSPSPHPWQSNTESPSPEFHVSAMRISYPNPGIPSGGCFAGVPDSSCALSLLSNQSCDSRSRSSSLGANYLLDTNASHLVQPSVAHGANISNFSSSSWGFKGNEAGTSSFDMHPELGLGQISQPGNSQYTGDLPLAHQTGRQYMDLEHPRAYDSSSQHMHWSL